jgi:hypothetical protein
MKCLSSTVMAGRYFQTLVYVPYVDKSSINSREMHKISINHEN